MKFATNGCLLLATKDGATIEIREEIGEENMVRGVGDGVHCSGECDTVTDVDTEMDTEAEMDMELNPQPSRDHLDAFTISSVPFLSTSQ